MNIKEMIFITNVSKYYLRHYNIKPDFGSQKTI